MLEAMASGAPVVATETDGAKQLLGINGRLVRIEDPVDLCRGVTALLEDKNIREDAAADAVARAAAMFDVARMIDDTHNLYETVLREK